MWQTIGASLSLLILILQEYFSASAQAKAANQTFELNQENFRAIVNQALLRQLASMAVVSKGQGSGWDAADKATKGDDPQ